MHLCFAPATSTDKVMFFTDKGNCYHVATEKLKETRFNDVGFEFATVFPEAKGEKPVAVFAVGDKMPEGKLLFYTKDGMVKVTDWSEYGVNKSVFCAVKVKEGDSLMGVIQLEAEGTILMITKQGMCLNYVVEEIPEQGRVSGGVKGIMLAEGDEIVYVGQILPEGEIVVITDKAYMKRVLACDFDIMTRYRKGVKVSTLVGDNGNSIMWAGYVKEAYNIALIDPSCTYIVNTEDIRIDSRTSKGKPPRDKRKGMPLTEVVHFKISL